MRIAAFSDVHGNIAGFRAAIRIMRDFRPDMFVFCGDICGYYYDQDAVVDEMRALAPLTAVRGNHDENFLRLLEDDAEMETLTRKYGSSYHRLKLAVKPSTLDFLRALPDSAHSPDRTWAVFHGSPWNPMEEYIYPTTDISGFDSLPYRYVFLGHTHHPMDRTSGAVRVINPGSCGQPRDEGRGSVALVDTDAGAVDIRRYSYDQTALRRQISDLDPGVAYLSAVLDRPARGIS